MHWYYAVGLGTLGGSVVSLVALYTDIMAWREVRREYRSRGRDDLPVISRFIDPMPDLLVLLTRVACGSVAGWLVHTEVTGVTPVIAAGAAAPAILAQFGKSPAYSAGFAVEPQESADDGRYEGRHIRIDDVLSENPDSVPRQRVTPDQDNVAQGGD